MKEYYQRLKPFKDPSIEAFKPFCWKQLGMSIIKEQETQTGMLYK